MKHGLTVATMLKRASIDDSNRSVTWRWTKEIDHPFAVEGWSWLQTMMSKEDQIPNFVSFNISLQVSPNWSAEQYEWAKRNEWRKHLVNRRFAHSVWSHQSKYEMNRYGCCVWKTDQHRSRDCASYKRIIWLASAEARNLLPHTARPIRSTHKRSFLVLRPMTCSITKRTGKSTDRNQNKFIFHLIHR